LYQQKQIMQTNQYHLLPPKPKLTEKDFARISDYVQKHVGIKLPLTKLILVESRLIKRVLTLNLTSFAEYVNYVFGPQGNDEKVELVNFLCTNKTDFFREVHHFTFLEKYIITNKLTRPINIWSAACSSGEEPYTIAMVLDELISKGFDGHYNILATDISSAILQKAMSGEFLEDKYAAIPKTLLKKYFTLQNNKAVVKSHQQRNITFQKFNLIDDPGFHDIDKMFEFIFCRNVLIYFDQPTQTRVIENLAKKLVPGGILFLGHSETLMGRKLNLTQLQPTIYQKPYA
jgi:chemotaxis protein methyltransferase CheR